MDTPLEFCMLKYEDPVFFFYDRLCGMPGTGKRVFSHLPHHFNQRRSQHEKAFFTDTDTEISLFGIKNS